VSKIALIPARGGSKGLLNKNLQKIGEESLVERIINKAFDSGIFNEIVLSSDSDEILKIGDKKNVLALRRPDSFSHDHSQAKDVVQHYLDSLEFIPSDETIITYLQPSSPFTSIETIRAINGEFNITKKPTVSVCQSADPVTKLLYLRPDFSLTSLLPEGNPTQNRQDSIVAYRASGGCYVFSVGDFRISGDIPVLGANGFLVSDLEGFDIDTKLDLEIARFIEGNLSNEF
jgi:N-acylneuraminate cytidylyltransferase